MNTVMAMVDYMQLHPEQQKSIEIVTPFVDVFSGLAEKYSFIRIKSLGNPGNPDEHQLCAEDLKARDKKVVAFTNSGDDRMRALTQARTDTTLAIVDMFVNRNADGLTSWQQRNSPYQTYDSYPTKAYRFFEMLVGEKLTNDPSSGLVDIPPSQVIVEKGKQILLDAGLEGSRVHVLNESASQPLKRFDEKQLEQILTEMAEYCEEEMGEEDSRIVFIYDPRAHDSFHDKIDLLPDPIKSRIVKLGPDLSGVGGIISQAESVLGLDTGISHWAGAMGKRTLVVHTMADPFLWSSGGPNTAFIATEQALKAHDNQTPLNMINGFDLPPWSASQIPAADVVNQWKSLVRKDLSGKVKSTHAAYSA